MKLAPMIMVLVILEVVIIFITGSYSDDSYTLDPYNTSTIVNTSSSSNSLWEFIADPTDWSVTNLLTTLATAAGVFGAVAFIVGTFVSTKSDMILLISTALMFFGFGSVPIISLYTLIMSNSAFFGCTGLKCPIAIMIFMLTGGLIAIFYVLAVLEWWSGRTTS